METELPYPKKMKFETNPTQWDHHRGGWTQVLSTLYQLSSPNGEGTLLVSAVEEWACNEEAITEPWIGFVHQVPRNNCPYYPDLERLVKDEYFLASLSKCHGLFVISEMVKSYLVANLPSPVPVAKILYPVTPFPREKMFEWSKFEVSKRVLFIGEFLRNYQAFYDLEIPSIGDTNELRLRKYLLKPKEVNFDKLKDLNRQPYTLVTNDTVTVIDRRLSDDEYDEWLSSSVVFLNLFDAPANTTVIECIGRGTPIVINRLPGIEEYLGREYPLFYDTLQEASSILIDSNKLKKGMEYIRNLPIKDSLTQESFISSFANTSIYRSLPSPPFQSPSLHFPHYDLTIVICSYKRVYNIPKILQAFKQQDYGARNFEIILWNNNVETQQKLSAIVSNFDKDLNIRLIQSSHNYYCIVRLAVAHLMYSDHLLICDDDVIPNSNYVSTFVTKYRQYGPRAVLCCRGHVFKSHTLNVENPQSFWEDYEHMKFFNETKPDRQVS